MKLRIRRFETNETIKIDVPSPTCTLQQLKNQISQSLPSSASSSSSNSIHLSLNRKDELQSSEETLQSCGITSGDLIFFTFNSNGFSISPKTLTPKSQPTQDSILLSKSDTPVTKEPEAVKNLDPHEAETLDLVPQGEETEEVMEVDDRDYSDMMVDVNFTKSFSVPGFLRKVFTEELNGDDGGRDHKLLVVALHAVFVESGFVLLDPVSFTESQFWKYWPSGASSRMTLFYTLPEVIHKLKRDNINVNHTVELKFHCLGKFFIAHGSLSGGVSTRRVTLNEDKLVPFLNVAWANCGLHEEVTGTDGNSGTSPKSEVFQFWRNVKDGLVLPLLIDLCEKAGLELPLCFMRLPTDLKLKVLELLPGVDIAKVSCVSSELLYLASSDDLWKTKFMEQFGDANTSGEGGRWKEKFVKSWERRKRRKLSSRRRVFDPLRFPRGPLPFFPGPWRPHIIGGDHDLLPPPFENTGNPLGRARSSMFFRRSHVPRCTLGGHWSNFT